jgi:isopenicillin N synthase-like dioxygenase
MTDDTIPIIDLAPLFAGPGPARDATDAAIGRAAREAGFMVATGLPADARLDAGRLAALFAVFELPDADKRGLWRRKFAPENPNVYRGWFPVQAGGATHKEGIDIGADAVDAVRCRPGDPLTEPTPWPAGLPGWRDAVARRYAAMEALGFALLRALARVVGVAEDHFDALFAGGNSTLRLIRYPERPAGETPPEAAIVEDRGRRRLLIGAPHKDSGCVTLLHQDGTGGLQARGAGGGWIDVPPVEDSLAINFGMLLELWTGGAVVATEHRVLGGTTARTSMPFFFEPSVDALIEPLPGTQATFEPVRYGDYLWRRMQAFVEFRGLGDRAA